MSTDIAVPESAASPAEPEPIRVLVPSRIGAIGVEFRHTAISRVVIAPKASAKRAFHSLVAFEESDFLDEVFGRISEFLAGARRSLDLEYYLDPVEHDAFTRRVLRETVKTAYGRTRTYKEIADGAGRPEAYRQVMSILERNPLPLLVPCHRVVPSKSGIGHWVGGTARKRWLLKMEAENAPLLS